MKPLITTNEEATDALFSTSASHLAELLGSRTKRQIHSGQDAYESARLAGSFGNNVLNARTSLLAFPERGR